MKTRVVFMFVAAIAISTCAQEQQFEKVLEGFVFTEGPVFDKAGNLYFTEIPLSKIHRYTPDGELTVYLENTEGANGLAFDGAGNLLACAGKGRKIVRYNQQKEREVLLERVDGKKLNSPNDLWIDPDGGIYFTDPRYGKTDDMEQDGMHVFYFHPKKGKAVRVISNMTRPNGIIGSADGKQLYVVDEKEREFYRYDIQKPGKLTNQTLLLDKGTDGMSRDDKGNIFLTAVNQVIKYAPSDGSFTYFPMDVNPTNVVWHEGEIWVTSHSGEVRKMRGF